MIEHRKQRSRKRILCLLPLLFLLSGCWSNVEINETVMAVGTGFNKKDDELKITVEIMKPEISASGQSVKSMLIEETGPTVLEVARKLIRQAKRRVVFTHNRVWIIQESVAKDTIIVPLDILKRDQMLRLNSFIFVTPKDPKIILSTPTLIENLVSMELASSMEFVKYTAEFIPMDLESFFESLAGPMHSTVVPIITNRKISEKEWLTELVGSAVIKGDKMIGKLTSNETEGLQWLRGAKKGGALTTKIDGKYASFEVNKVSVECNPELKKSKLDVTYVIKAKGFLGDMPPNQVVDENFIGEFEDRIEQELIKTLRNTLEILQKELKTDVTNIGLDTYRKYPGQWKELQKQWHEKTFADADIKLDVQVIVSHKGLSKRSLGGTHEKPQYNPYLPGKHKTDY